MSSILRDEFEKQLDATDLSSGQKRGSIPILASSAPLLPEVGVIAMVADDWSEEWMSRHQILTRLAKYFQVVWVNPAQDWHQNFHRAKKTDPKTSHLASSFQVYETEYWLPKFYRPRFLVNFTFRKRLERARDRLLRRGCRKIILYIWRPEFGESLDAVPFDFSCYHIVDEYTFSDVELPTSNAERALLERVDHVFVHTQALLEKKGQLNPRVTLVPNGVAYSAFAAPAPEPAGLTTIPHPRIGYVGYLKKTLNWDLLSELSARHPEYSFVFVGAQKNEEVVFQAVERLSSRPNVYFLGAVTTSEIVRYPQHFDVCIMPYVLNDYTKYVYPLKLHEYLASGRPAVGSPTRLLREFQETIQLCTTAEEWSAAIARAMRPEANSTEARWARQDLAKKHDWDVLVHRIARVLCQGLNLENELPLNQISGELICE